MSVLSEFTKGFYKQNPVFKQALGLCPVLAVSNSVESALGMGMAATFVLLCSNIIISLIRNIVPAKIRIPIYIVVIATFVTIVDLSMAGFLPALHKTLGIFVPLIVVNCIILGRAEAFASKNKLSDSLIDGIVMGLGFTIALTLLGSIREILGAGSIFGWKFVSEEASTVVLFILPPGAFIALGFLIAVVNMLTKKKA